MQITCVSRQSILLFPMQLGCPRAFIPNNSLEIKKYIYTTFTYPSSIDQSTLHLVLNKFTKAILIWHAYEKCYIFWYKDGKGTFGNAKLFSSNSSFSYYISTFFFFFLVELIKLLLVGSFGWLMLDIRSPQE